MAHFFQKISKELFEKVKNESTENCFRKINNARFVQERYVSFNCLDGLLFLQEFCKDLASFIFIYKALARNIYICKELARNTVFAGILKNTYKIRFSGHLWNYIYFPKRQILKMFGMFRFTHTHFFCEKCKSQNFSATAFVPNCEKVKLSKHQEHLITSFLNRTGSADYVLFRLVDIGANRNISWVKKILIAHNWVKAFLIKRKCLALLFLLLWR